MRAMTLRQWARHLDGRAEVALVTDELRLGLSLGFWATPGDATQTVLAAERLGYDSVWTSEGSGSDALTPLAWYGARTSRIKLGTAVIQLSARTPAATAMAAVRGAVRAAAGAYREYVDLLRVMWCRQRPARNTGPHYCSPTGRGAGSARLKLLDLEYANSYHDLPKPGHSLLPVGGPAGKLGWRLLACASAAREPVPMTGNGAVNESGEVADPRQGHHPAQDAPAKLRLLAEQPGESGGACYGWHPGLHPQHRPGCVLAAHAVLIEVQPLVRRGPRPHSQPLLHRVEGALAKTTVTIVNQH